jgi:uncharacterized membrane protein
LLAGFFVSVPLVISVFAIVWIFGIIDGLTAPLAAWILRLGEREPTGAVRLLASAVGLLGTVAVVLVIGAVATNVIGRRALAADDSRVPDDLRPGQTAGRGVLAG